jgi:hypothetical protein
LLETRLNQRYRFATEVLQDIKAALDIRHPNLLSPKKPIAPALSNSDNSTDQARYKLLILPFYPQNPSPIPQKLFPYLLLQISIKP